MSWSQQSQSPEALSDPLPRIYACFCQKRFTTYPGIYLHLKSKHSHLFQKYKKLKITKLFKKTHDDKGIQVYRLQKLSDTQGPGSYLSQKKIKQKEKRKKEVRLHLDISPGDNRHEQPLKKIQTVNLEVKPQEIIHENPYPPPPLFPPLTTMNTVIPQISSAYPQMNNYMTFPSHQVNCSFMTPQIPAPYPTYSLHHTVLPTAIQSKPTLKKIMQKFLFESSIMDRSLLKSTLYDLMIFIDKNYQVLKDPRATGKQFLSYCDEFDPLAVKPLLQEYIGKINEEVAHIEDEIQQTIRKKEIDYLVKFLVWLGELGLIQFSLKFASTIKEEEQALTSRNSLSTTVKVDVLPEQQLTEKTQQSGNK